MHLEGAILPHTAVELAARHDVSLTPEDVAARYAYSDFRGFLETFKWVTSFLRGPEDYALITRNLAEELVKQNVVYAEITVSAGVMLRRTQNVEANFQAIREVAQSVPFSRLRTAWIFDATRQFGHDQAMEVARVAAKLQSSGVVALGMGGDELAFPTVNFRRSGICPRSHRTAGSRAHRARHCGDARRSAGKFAVHAARRSGKLSYEQLVYWRLGQANWKSSCNTERSSASVFS